MATERLRANAARVVRDTGRSFRAAVTLMEGTTGEVLALASFPARVDDLPERERRSPDQQKLTEINQNFVALPIGSTAKVPFALSILDWSPRLASLEIETRRSYRSLLGFDLGGDYKDDHIGSGERIGFRAFLERSSNRYAAMLMLLGTLDPNANLADADPRAKALARDPFWVDGTPYDLAPASPAFHDARWGPYGATIKPDSRMVDRGWSTNFTRIFADHANPELKGGSASFWEGASFAASPSMASVLPEPLDLGFDNVDFIGSDYVMSILGGNRSRWPTIKLAEAYSRIVSGRMVSAHVLPLLDSRLPKRIRMLEDHKDTARQAVLDGMRHVILGEHGTAGRLAGYWPGAELPGQDGSVTLLYAKTGTPNIIRRPITPMDAFSTAPQCALYRNGTTGQLSFAGSSPASAHEWRAAISAAPEQCASLRALDAENLQQIASQLYFINRSRLRDQVVAGPDGIVKWLPDAAQDEKEFGKTLVLVAARYARRGARLPCGVRTIAINFQSRSAAAAQPALLFAGDLIRTPAVARWLASPCAATR
ncbi:MAG: hypothetical protein WDN24_01355 [Sphingomonas sp.]